MPLGGTGPRLRRDKRVEAHGGRGNSVTATLSVRGARGALGQRLGVAAIPRPAEEVVLVSRVERLRRRTLSLDGACSDDGGGAVLIRNLPMEIPNPASGVLVLLHVPAAPV